MLAASCLLRRADFATCQNWPCSARAVRRQKHPLRVPCGLLGLMHMANIHRDTLKWSCLVRYVSVISNHVLCALLFSSGLLFLV